MSRCAHVHLHMRFWTYSHSRLSSSVSLLISLIPGHIAVASVGMDLQALMFAWRRFLGTTVSCNKHLMTYGSISQQRVARVVKLYIMNPLMWM